MRDEVGRHVGQQDALLLHRALADQALAERGCVSASWPSPRGRSSTAAAAGLSSSPPVEVVDGALLRVHQRRQLGQQHLADGVQLALALQHAGELGEVGLQPVLLAVALGGLAQVRDHRVDVVLQLGDLAARLDLDRARQVALGHGGGDLGDGAHLRGEVGGQQVDVAGEVLPGAGGAGHVRLAAEPAVDADLARHVGHLVGEGRERVGHVVDGVGERRDLALGLHGQALASGCRWPRRSPPSRCRAPAR